MPHPSLRSTLAGAIALLTACVGALSLKHAVQWYGHPFAGILVTPEGIVSSIGMPTWSGIEQGLRFPDHVLAIDGIKLTAVPGEYVGQAWDRAIESAARRGAQFVHASVETDQGLREVDLRVQGLDPSSWWLYAGMMIFSGSMYALSAVIAVKSSTSGLARAFAKFATLGAIYLFTFFEAHTTRTMVAVTYGAYAYLPFALGALVLRLPDDVRLVARYPWLLRLFDIAALALAGVVAFRGALGGSAATLPTVCTMLLGGALIASVVVLGGRYFRATGVRRQTIAVLFRAMATPYVLVGIGVLVSLLSSRGSTTAFFAIPAMALAPVATGIAFARHDLWGSRQVLSRGGALGVAGAIAAILAAGVGSALAASFGFGFRGAFVGASLGAIASALLVYFATRSVERSFFPAVSEYKPTIEQLSEELTSITDPNEVCVAVERTVRRWLPCERVRFVTASDEVGTAASHPTGGRATEEQDELSIPASFGGRTLGGLSVGRKRGGALFTTADVALLRTIANQAGLALAHAHSYAELERRRQQQAAAWQTERLALVETVAAEIAHEVRYPINFFRSVFRRDGANAALDEEEIDIGCEEVDRLERLVSGLRRMVVHRIDRRLVSVTDLAARTEMLLRDALVGRALDVQVPMEAALRCDTDQVTQVLVNLVANAIDASGGGGHVGIDWKCEDDGAELVVWDDGPGFATDPSQLFSAWYTTKPRGTGLGLAITQRIIRAHGWGIDAVRRDGQTRFVVSIPVSDVVETIGAESATVLKGEAISRGERLQANENTHRR